MTKLKDTLKIISLGLGIITTVRALSPSEKASVSTAQPPYTPVMSREAPAERISYATTPAIAPAKEKRKAHRKVAKQVETPEPTKSPSDREADQAILDRVRLGFKNGDYTK